MVMVEYIMSKFGIDCTLCTQCHFETNMDLTISSFHYRSGGKDIVFGVCSRAWSPVRKQALGRQP